ncbi:MAG TPA: diguanylate cyclase [Actinoplanes sp.]|nr:diguanylate cyclase [Actinoplanes sp.]
MTLRGRLTAAFLAVVLGPVLLGSLFVTMTVATVTRDRTTERLDHAATTVRTAVGALCRQLQAAADTVAVLPEDDRAGAADQLVARGIASALQVTDATGDAVLRTAAMPTGPAWRRCFLRAESTAAVAAVGAYAEIRDPAGNLVTTVSAVQTVDVRFLGRLAASTGADVTLLAGVGAGPAALTSADPATGAEVAALAATLPGGDPARTADGAHYVRRLPPEPGQPLPLALSVPVADPLGLYALLLVAIIAVTVLAVLAARWLAGSTTQPLAELVWAAGRVADGDLATRVPAQRADELGVLAGTFNRMTRELQAYVQALTASRDQLRGHLAILGDTLSSTHDLHRILRVILRSALSATGARAGAVLLVDPADAVLVARCAEGLPGRWAVPDEELTAVRVPVGEGVLGAVAASGEPRRGLAAREKWLMSAVEPPCRSFVAVPICAPVVAGDPLVPGRAEPSSAAAPTTLGVLALYDRLGPDEFDDADLLTLRTFAGQAGVAVNNVWVHEEAQRLSLTDPLTGLWNYRYLKESMRREVERANRFGRMLAVITLDLDHFKEVNDTYGHAAGDTVLVEFARRIKIGLREVDLAFRQGGEEFVVLLPETDAYGGAIVAERLGAVVRDLPVQIDPRRLDAVTGATVDSIAISVSIGVAVYPDHGAGARELLEAADDALYAAKAAGRDTYRVATAKPAAAPKPAAAVQPPAAAKPAPANPAAAAKPTAGAQPAVAAGQAPDAVSAPPGGGQEMIAPMATSAGALGGAPGGTQPPRQSRGR